MIDPITGKEIGAEVKAAVEKKVAETIEVEKTTLARLDEFWRAHHGTSLLYRPAEFAEFPKAVKGKVARDAEEERRILAEKA